MSVKNTKLVLNQTLGSSKKRVVFFSSVTVIPGDVMKECSYSSYYQSKNLPLNPNVR